MDLAYVALPGLSIAIQTSKMGVLCSFDLLVSISSQPVSGLDP